MKQLQVTDIERRVIHGRQELRAEFVLGRRRMPVWLRTDCGPISEMGDPFVPVALIPAMRRNWALRIDAPVSSDLLAGTRSIQILMTGWYTEFHRVSVEVRTELRQQATEPRRTATFFSGGVDSFFTLRQHLGQIDALIFIHGLDIPLRRRRERELASGSIHRLADSLGLELIEVETNLRRFGQPHVSWANAYFGAALAAVALLLAPRFGVIYVPASVAADQLMPMGSHPALDPLWSNGAMQLVHDGIEATRFDKVMAIGGWPPVQSHLRVCYQKGKDGRNCGRCRKCLWTMMMLSAAGYLDQIDTFGAPLDPRALRDYPPVHKYERDRFERALVLLQRRDADPDLQAVLREMLAANGQLPLRGWLSRTISRARTYLSHRLP